MSKLPFEIVDIQRTVQVRTTNKSPAEKFAEQVQQQIGLYQLWMDAGCPEKLSIQAGEKLKNARMWWFKRNNNWYMGVKYGIASLDMGGGKSNVQCGKEPVDVLNALKWLAANADKEPVIGWVNAAEKAAASRPRKAREPKPE